MWGFQPYPSYFLLCSEPGAYVLIWIPHLFIPPLALTRGPP